ncbi:MAG: hypothetical protein D6822_07070, partial [Cyanobacteria bacterium J149]
RRSYTIPLKLPIKYRFRRAYLQSAINILHRQGYDIRGFTATISGNIPQNAGLSSSSALTVAWVQFLLTLLGENPDPTEVAKLAYEAEVLEFEEPGGPQDHFATALGNVHFFEFPINEQPLFKQLNGHKLNDIAFVIGNSQVRKATLNTIRKIKMRVQNSMRQLGLSALDNVSIEAIPDESSYRTLKAILKIRDLTLEGVSLFQQSSVDPQELGHYLTRQHQILRDDLHLSIPRIEAMIKGALEAGAYGCKINGSGQGGCMIAICPPDRVKAVKQGIKKGQGMPSEVRIESGVRSVITEKA